MGESLFYIQGQLTHPRVLVSTVVKALLLRHLLGILQLLGPLATHPPIQGELGNRLGWPFSAVTQTVHCESRLLSTIHMGIRDKLKPLSAIA